MFKQIQEARERLAEYLRPTPLLLSEPLRDRRKGQVWLKLESMQPTGSFKVRPAFNSILVNLEQARECGVVTSSSGNFAQAAAYASRRLGVDAKIVMMRNASPFKIERTKQFGGDVVPCGNTFQERWDTTFRLQRESNRVLIHPYDSQETIAGDGTVGAELLDQLAADFCAVVPVSGGGLISGIATAVKHARPGCRVIGVQASQNPSMRNSLREGKAVSVTPGPTLADALVAATPGENTFPIVNDLVDDVITVDEDEIAAAVRMLAVEHKLIVEGGGAVGVAALLAGKIDARGEDVVFVLSGGNILPSKLAEILRDGDGAST